MVLSALLALGVLFDKRKIYFQGANDDSYKIIEIIASWILCIEQLLMAIYEFIQCNNLNTNRCLVSVQYFQVGLILLIIISETLYSKRCLYLLFRLWIIIYNIYSFSGEMKENIIKLVVFLHIFSAFSYFLQICRSFKKNI